ncbi:DUF2293 domain-containing protein [Parabacteroides sp. FAFU027]|uniref:DUF2293 domain-containing protein n=1 Tax=Parabacteroides sp. FAFU027 TaxID=2922715 RepID=UPI001FAFDADF|nr:DUF2293 domain-containing protein [Parabacteroides sp. FAFU027]
MKDPQTEKGIRIVRPANGGKLTGENGAPLSPPQGWTFLPAGDAGVTRKVTSKGKYWRVEVRKGRRTISLGIWAPGDTILQAQQEVQAMRSTEEYKKKKIYTAERREKKQAEYDAEFCQAIERYLNFHSNHKELEHKLARVVTAHAIPIGSGTVARTQLIPIEERAAHAVIAWMRHQTTFYDDMKIARIKGERRSIRRQLAQISVNLLAGYREGKDIDRDCPLQKALDNL